MKKFRYAIETINGFHNNGVIESTNIQNAMATLFCKYPGTKSVQYFAEIEEPKTFIVTTETKARRTFKVKAKNIDEVYEQLWSRKEEIEPGSCSGWDVDETNDDIVDVQEVE